MLFLRVCSSPDFVFDDVTTLATLKWGRGVENISYGTPNKWKSGNLIKFGNLSMIEGLALRFRKAHCDEIAK